MKTVKNEQCFFEDIVSFVLLQNNSDNDDKLFKSEKFTFKYITKNPSKIYLNLKYYKSKISNNIYFDYKFGIGTSWHSIINYNRKEFFTYNNINKIYSLIKR